MDWALAEARRVLRPGGRFLCLEFSRVVLPILDRLYDRLLLHRAAGARARGGRRRGLYRYLARASAPFPAQEAFAASIRAAGLGQVRYRNLSDGIAALHSAWRL